MKRLELQVFFVISKRRLVIYIYAPNFEKFGEHIGFRLSVCIYVWGFELLS